MKQLHNPEKLIEKVHQLRSEATGHKKARNYHRRRQKECLSEAERYEKQLAVLGIQLEIQKK